MRPITAERRAFDVVGFGECSVDEVWRLPALPSGASEKLRARERQRLGGGQIATAMVACARLGLRAGFLAAIGADEDGNDVIAGLRAEEVDTSGVIQDGRTTTRAALILVDERGERVVIEATRAPGSAPPPCKLREHIENARLLHLDATEPAYALLAAHHARQKDTRVSLDLDHPAPGIEELLPLVDICIASRGVPEKLTGERNLERALAALAQKTGALVGCTLEGDGAALYDGGHLVLSPAFAVGRPVDTTACGDTFRAGFLCALLDGRSPAQALRFGNAAAALKCRGIGRRGCPTRAEVNALLASA